MAPCGKTPPGLDGGDAQIEGHLDKEGIFSGLLGTCLPLSSPSVLEDLLWGCDSFPFDSRRVLQGLCKDRSRVPPKGTSFVHDTRQASAANVS